MVGLHVRILKN